MVQSGVNSRAPSLSALAILPSLSVQMQSPTISYVPLSTPNRSMMRGHNCQFENKEPKAKGQIKQLWYKFRMGEP